jgi:hypothetical protein
LKIFGTGMLMDVIVIHLLKMAQTAKAYRYTSKSD